MTKAKHIIQTILAIGLVLGLFAVCSLLASNKGLPDLADGLPDLDVGTWAGNGANPGDGHRYVKMGSYNGHKLVWRVLDVYVSDGIDGNVTGCKTALLLLYDLLRTSDGGIEYMKFDAGSGNWARPSDINAFLNGEFYSAAFSAREQEYIVTARYRLGGSYEGHYGFPSTDSSKVFLLSTDEANNLAYFAHDADRVAAYFWRLRSPGCSRSSATGVDLDGTVIFDGNLVFDVGVRPALKINLSSEIFTSADYAAVDTAIAAANGLNKDLYADFSEVEAAIATVRYGLSIDGQTTVDVFAVDINEAIAALACRSLPDLTIGTWAGTGDNPGDGHRCVTMGSYNGHELVWRVLDVYVSDGTDGNGTGCKTALLLLDDLLRTSEDEIESMQFDERSGNWARPSDIMAFLNGEFYTYTFSSDEKAQIVTARYWMGGKYDGHYGFPSTNSSKVFLPSEDEVNNLDYFANNADRSAECSWWLRSPSSDSSDAAYVSYAGKVPYYGCHVNIDLGVRPALKINLSSEIFAFADYAAVDTAIAAAKGLNKDLYADFSEVEAAIATVRYGLSIDEQTTVDGFATDINEAIAALACWSLPDLAVGTWAGTGANPGDWHRLITMGSYNGHELVWRVLDVYVSDGTDGNRAGGKTALLLLDDLLRTSDGSIERREFDKDSCNWARPSDIKAFLNGEFYTDAFSINEKAYIITANYRMGGSYEGSYGFPSTDSSKVFLLSTGEARDPAYFADESDRAVAGYWWLRSPGYFNFHASFVNLIGTVDFGGNYVKHDSYGVRPALKINLSSEILTSAP